MITCVFKRIRVAIAPEVAQDVQRRMRPVASSLMFVEKAGNDFADKEGSAAVIVHLVHETAPVQLAGWTVHLDDVLPGLDLNKLTG